MRKSILLAVLLFVAVLPGWSLRDRVLYHYDMWQVAHADEGEEAVEYDEKIQALHGKAVDSCLVDTYNDTTLPKRMRRSAAKALMKSDVVLAATVFRRQLDSTDTEVAAMAIRDLGSIKNRTYRKDVLDMLKSGNEVVRWSVVDYLGKFNDPETIEILNGIRSSDDSDFIRNAASKRLKELSGQTSNRFQGDFHD